MFFNKIVFELKFEIGEILDSLGCGWYIIRVVSFYNVYKGKIVDIFGFFFLDYEVDNVEDLNEFFLEFCRFSYFCKFCLCMYIYEFKCVVKEVLI